MTSLLGPFCILESRRVLIANNSTASLLAGKGGVHIVPNSMMFAQDVLIIKGG
jgi:hypothetical protein